MHLAACPTSRAIFTVVGTGVAGPCYDVCVQVFNHVLQTDRIRRGAALAIVDDNAGDIRQ